MSLEKSYYFILKKIDLNYWGLTLSFFRVSLAISLLLNLLFNSNQSLMISPKKNLNYFEPEYFSLYYIFEPTIAKLISIIVLLLVISGFFIKISALLHFWVAYSFNVSAKMIEGGDQVVLIYSLLLIPILLLDGRKNHWQKEIQTHSFNIKTIAFSTFLLMKIQFFVIYFFASISKFTHKEWHNGTAIYYWFNDKVFGLNSFFLDIFNPILKNSFGVLSLTWGTLFIELFIAYGAFSNNTLLRHFCFILGVILHLSIAVLFGLWSFFFAMLGILIYILLDLDKIKIYYEKSQILSKL